jgi:hypothetical protein
VTILRVSLASSQVSSRRLLSWKAKQMTCCTRLTMSLLQILRTKYNQSLLLSPGVSHCFQAQTAPDTRTLTPYTAGCWDTEPNTAVRSNFDYRNSIKREKARKRDFLQDFSELICMRELHMLKFPSHLSKGYRIFYCITSRLQQLDAL